jgi:hypothetical protein
MVASQNSKETAPARIGKPWPKGQSGNPGGRPRAAADVKTEAQKHTREALNRLVHWMRSDDPQASIRASITILERGCGKPEHAVTVKDSDRFPKGPIRISFDPFGGRKLTPATTPSAPALLPALSPSPLPLADPGADVARTLPD